MNGAPVGANENKGRLLVLLVLLGAALAVVCREGFLPHRIMWANDSPLGQIKSLSARLPDTFTGHWGADYWIGTEIPSSSPTLATLLATVISPELYMKIFTPLTMLLLGFSAWLLFRQLRFAPPACVLGGLAAGLNMHFFSVACWGLGTLNISSAMIFLAFAALLAPSIRQLWIKGAMAGLAVGMSVMEGFDSGAILSIYAGIFIVFLCLTTESSAARGALKSAGLGVVVVAFSVFIAASTLSTLVGTQIKGIGGMGQTAAEKRDHWDFATQWSVPKLETLRVIIPGIFGYRMVDYTTSPDKSGVYWGRIAEDARLMDMESGDPKLRASTAAALGVPAQVGKSLLSADHRERAAAISQILGRLPLQRRHSGNGEYAGVLVALMAVFALGNSLRKDGAPYSPTERRMVWFFGAAALFSLVAACGRHAPLYALLYKLPYFSTIRNPIKFMHPFQVSWIILAGFGFEALYRCYLQPAPTRKEALLRRPKGWWRRAAGFDRNWAVALGLVVVLAAAGWVMVSRSSESIINYLEDHGFGADVAPQMAAFSLGEIGWFVVFLAASVIAIVCVFSGIGSGRRGGWVWMFLFAGIIIWDLGRSDRPWVRYFDYKEKYAMNPIVDFLRQKPYEHRVGAKLSPRDSYYALAGPEQPFGGICHWWLENDFPYNNIQAVDIDQMPRSPVWDGNYLGIFSLKNSEDLTPAVRLWKLTNTRFVLMAAGLVGYVNDHGDPLERGFQIRALFDMALKPGVTDIEDGGDLTPQLNEKGPLALVELTNALPRAKLYSRWQTLEEDAALKTLASTNFNANDTVILDKDTPVAQPPGAPGADAGTVTITSYKPKDVKLEAAATVPSVLLLNERTAPEWHVRVDDKPAALLRCNYLMRGVYLPPGRHAVEFRFSQSLGPLYISLGAFAAGICLMIYLLWVHWRERVWPVSARTLPAPEKAKV